MANHLHGASRSLFVAAALLCSTCFSACAGSPPPAPITPPAAVPPSAATPSAAVAPAVPPLRLPAGVRPTSYSLELTITPKSQRFAGRTQIVVQLDGPTQLIWLHGRSLNVVSARALVTAPGAAQPESITATYKQVNDDGVASLSFERALPAGSATLEIIYDAAFDKDLKGLYRVDSGGEAYAFTQFEAISARLAFPSFDDPGFKTPFDVWLTVPASDFAASNEQVLSEEPVGEGLKRVHFATTKPLPTYLVAFAVGPFDIVTAAPIAPSAARAQAVPLRGIAVKGKGPLLARALATTSETLLALERYFGIAYPYSKLDMVAVPDFAAGAMENAGLVTFREYLLLLDPKQVTEGQLRSSAYVISHELAHQWFGDLVTMHFWDDIWLNEGFATWMGYRTVAELHPEYKADIAFLGAVFDAMHSDARLSARMIRQPITSTHDIANAFDGITYSKGGGVLAMFERYAGVEPFRAGVQHYLQAHAYGNASTDDLLQALSASSGRDMQAPFNGFLTQVGVPLLAAEVACDAASNKAELRLRQTRYLPLGSAGAKGTQSQWQIPVCARYEVGGSVKESCALLASETASMPLEAGPKGESCPTWLMPNAGAAGYYRFALPVADLDKLRAHQKQLTARERYALVEALEAGFESGAFAGKDLLSAASAFASDDNRVVATAPMGFLRQVRNEIVSEAQRPAVEKYIRELYLPLQKKLGYREAKNEPGDTKLLRADVLSFLADAGQDAPTRTRMQSLGALYLGLGSDGALHPGAVPADITDLAVRVAVQDGDVALWDALYARFKQSEDSLVRARLLRALCSVRDARSDKALALALDPALRVNEVFLPLREQISDPRTRAAAWQWFETNFDALLARVSTTGMGWTPWLAAAFCDDAMATRARAFFTPRMEKLVGAPRSLAGASEALTLCAATASAQRSSVVAFFEAR